VPGKPVMTELLLDSDVIIDLLAKRAAYKEAAALISLIAEGKIAAYATPIIFANVNYILIKYSGRSKAEKAIRSLRKILSVLPMDENTVDSALDSEFRDFEDAMQYVAAEKKGIDFIITRNKKDYVKGKIKALTAQEYMDMYESDI
jgi:predicted nucleic acid-binding protein